MNKPKTMPRKRFYTPQLHESNVRRLHFYARKLGIPMTKLLNLIVQTALEELNKAPAICDDEVVAIPPVRQRVKVNGRDVSNYREVQRG